MGQQTSDPVALQEAMGHTRLWEYFLHEDSMIMQRGNLFLVAQSLQLVAYTAILSSGGGADRHTHATIVTARIIAVFGIALAAIWVYVGHRQIRYTDALRTRLANLVDDFAQTQAAVNIRGPKSAVFIAYAIPALAGTLWALLLVVN